MKTIKMLQVAFAIGIFCAAGICHADLSDGLVAFYPFNGNADDESGYGHHGSESGVALIEDRFGNLSSAYYFDGIDDYITCGNDASLMPESMLTVSVWIRWFGESEFRYIIGRNDDNTKGYQIFIADDNRVRFGIDTTLFYSNSSLAEGGWYHIVLTYDGAVGKGYINGVQQNDFGSDVGGIDYTGYNFQMGIQDSIGPYPFCGVIDDVYIYDRVLDYTEIQQLLNEMPFVCSSDYNGDGVVNKRDVRLKRKNMKQELKYELRSWIENCWLPNAQIRKNRDLDDIIESFLEDD